MTKNNDREYWNDYYKESHDDINEHTLFAEYILKNWLSDKRTILECGCGNGRDSLYFFNHGFEVVGVDASEITITNLGKDTHANCKFLCADFVDSDEVWNKKIDVVYSRFSLHAIHMEQEGRLLKRVYHHLNSGGIFCIEARSIHDELYGKGKLVGVDEYLYNDHHRRFIRMENILMHLIETGFEIKYAEENIGFAPMNRNNPPIIRIVCTVQK